MVANKINTVNTVGTAISAYYSNKEDFMDTIGKKQSAEKILGKFISELKE
jgi:hypothetical protein